MTVDQAIIDAVGTAADAWDIRVIVRRCYLYDFTSGPLRLWDGVGKLTAGGYDWIGTIDADGNNRHTVAQVRDERDGSSPRYEFGVPYVDQVTFDLLKADKAQAAGRDLTAYSVFFDKDEGLLPQTALRFEFRLTMQSTRFEEKRDGVPGEEVNVRSAFVIVRPGEFGQQTAPNGTYTATGQRERARLLGVSADSGCDFVAKNARRTFTRQGG